MSKEDVFLQLVKEEQFFLAFDESDFDNLLRKTMTDRRVRNAFVFYVLTDKEYLNRFRLLANHSLHVKRLHSSLYQALWNVERDSLNQEEVRKMAKRLRTKYLTHPPAKLAPTERLPVREMEKFFVTLMNKVVNEQEINPERDRYREELLKKVDYTNLFVTPK
ncbi:hypothetical protein MM300_07350 [Evansella sp. LMS18]|uniref:hypothetical protein n=1 Tax=Evansella sp. LMS18 TaxID=2924033 RepID=UPI0020D1154D|nr:hypothetical protein [Evansella sp. LMS18]UTR12099.1 hypothetical protein MM300_07350 [Evansella sp. LMS18]